MATYGNQLEAPNHWNHRNSLIIKSQDVMEGLRHGLVPAMLVGIPEEKVERAPPPALLLLPPVPGELPLNPKLVPRGCYLLKPYQLGHLLKQLQIQEQPLSRVTYQVVPAPVFSSPAVAMAPKRSQGVPTGIIKGTLESRFTTGALKFPVKRRRPGFCKYCLGSNESESFAKSHVLRDEHGIVRCPNLRKMTCEVCQATGDRAHTTRHCPLMKKKKYKKRKNTEQ